MRADIYVIIDKLVNEIRSRSDSFKEVNDLFGFLHELTYSDESKIRTHAMKLYDIYKEDLDVEFIEECVHLKEFLLQFNANPNSQKLPSSDLLII